MTYPQFPQQPQQPYNPYAQPAPQYAPPAQFPGMQGVPPAYGGYAPQPQAPAYQGPPPAQGTLGQFFNAPSSESSGPGISWTDKITKAEKPLQSAYAVVVVRDAKDADVRQQTTMATQVEPSKPKFYRDGQPMFELVIPVKVQATPEFPDGLATWYIRGQARDELIRAMTEAGAPKPGQPMAGDMALMTLVQRKPSRGGGRPANIVAIQYHVADPNRVPEAPAAPAAEAPAAAQAQWEPAAPVQPAGPLTPQFPTAPAPQPVAAPVQPQFPAAQQPAAAPVAGGLTPEQQQAVDAALAKARAQVNGTAPEAAAGPPVAAPAGEIVKPAGLSPEASAVFDKLAAGRAAHPAS